MKLTPLAEVLVLRTSAANYWLVGGIMCAAFVLGIFVAVTKDVWQPTVISGFLLAAVMSVFWSTTLKLTSDAIHYRSLFVRTNVLLSDVIAAKFVVGFSGYKPYQRLVITVREKSGEKEITINNGLFDRIQIERWIDALNARLA
jgi:hypothetical protein